MTIASLAMVARHALVALVVGMMSVALNISVAAVIYQGPLGVFLDRAIALALIGGVVMGIASALMFSYRGTICQPQIAMAGVLTVAAAGMAAGMADPASEPAFATIAALVIATAALTGLATWLLGSLRLGVVARFVPFPVLTGFLAATGYLLIVGGLGMALGRPLRLGNLDLLFDTGQPDPLGAVAARRAGDLRADPAPRAGRSSSRSGSCWPAGCSTWPSPLRHPASSGARDAAAPRPLRRRAACSRRCSTGSRSPSTAARSSRRRRASPPTVGIAVVGTA